jgi:hypothetical protein
LPFVQIWILMSTDGQFKSDLLLNTGAVQFLGP